jgi:replicative DNA helicase
MGNQDLLNRLLTHTGIPLKVLERPWKIPGSEWEAPYRAELDRIKNWSLDILFQPSANSDYLVEQTLNNEYDFLIVDHVHRFSWGNDRRKLEDELAKLTNLALDFNIPVLILAQLRRFQRGHGMETYPSPTLQDFRETEALGNEASRAMAIWREREPNGQTYSEHGMTHFIVLKDRFGPLGSVLVKFDGKRQLFLDPAHARNDQESVESSATVHPAWQGIAQ